jgi:DNA uptake protein ComE-like DNA-binding protein
MMVTIFALTMFLSPILNKPVLHNATYKELTEITGIGDIKAELILSYIKTNKECDIGDLDDINGIGDILVDRIDEAYR